MHFAGSTDSGSAGLTGSAAGFATSGLVLEAFFCIEFLFAGSEHEFGAAVFTNQRFVFVHGKETPKKLISVIASADLVFAPTLAVWKVAQRICALTHFSRNSVPDGLTSGPHHAPRSLNGLRGPFCLRLASAFNHRPEEIDRCHYRGGTAGKSRSI